MTPISSSLSLFLSLVILAGSAVRASSPPLSPFFPFLCFFLSSFDSPRSGALARHLPLCLTYPAKNDPYNRRVRPAPQKMILTNLQSTFVALGCWRGIYHSQEMILTFDSRLFARCRIVISWDARHHPSDPIPSACFFYFVFHINKHVVFVSSYRVT